MIEFERTSRVEEICATYSIKFDELCSLKGEVVEHCNNGGNYYQIVVVYGSLMCADWLYQNYAKTLEEAKTILEMDKKWLYNVEKEISSKVSHYTSRLVDDHKMILNKNEVL